MTHKRFEEKLQSIDPRFSLKRSGRGYMGVYHKNKYVLRISERDIPLWDVLKKEVDHQKEYMTGLNQTGVYTWERLIHRGRHSIAEELWKKHLISHSDKAKLH